MTPISFAFALIPLFRPNSTELPQNCPRPDPRLKLYDDHFFFPVGITASLHCLTLFPSLRVSLDHIYLLNFGFFLGFLQSFLEFFAHLFLTYFTVNTPGSFSHFNSPSFNLNVRFGQAT